MKIAQVFQALIRFADERFPLHKASFHDFVEKKEVPLHRLSWAYYLGGLALLFFVIQLGTGLMLLFYYEPTVSDAHASVEFISHHVQGGALVRNLHAWTSSCMILIVLVHLVTTFAMKAFGKPREITWVTGVVLLFITFVFGFTGYLLPWNQIAVYATKVGLQSIEECGQYLPGAMAAWPGQLKELIQGGPAVGQATLSRFFAIHVIVLPLATFLLLGVHLFSVQLHGMSPGVDQPTGRTEKFFPVFMVKDFTLWGVAALLLFTVALCLPFDVFMPFPLLAPFDPLGATPDGIKPEWYFYFVYYPLELLPFWVIIVGMTLVVIGLFLVPWLYRRTSRRTLAVLALLMAAYLVVMTLYGQDIYNIFKGGGP